MTMTGTPGLVERPGHDWLRSARPFFTAFGPDTPIGVETVRERVRLAAESGADTFMCFVESEGYALWPSEVVARSSLAREGLDVVAAMSEVTSAAGLRFVPMWMGCHCQTLHLREHPSWTQRDALGHTNAAMCLNSPYGGSLLNQVREVVAAYRPDGVYFDGLYARVGGCYCRYCSQRFEALHGRDLPVLADLSSDATDISEREHWISFSAEPRRGDRALDGFRVATVNDFLRRVRDVIDRHGDSALLLDTLGVMSAYYTNGHDLGRMAESVDAFVLESYWEQQGETVLHVALEADLVRAETKRPVWWARWLARHPDGNQVSVPEATVRTWSAQALVRDLRPLVVEQNLFSVDDRLADAAADALRMSREVGDLLDGNPRHTYAALLHSPRTKAEVHAEWRARDYFDALEGTHQALNEAHVPTEVIAEDGLEPTALAERYRVLIIPNAMYLSPDTHGVLADYVAAGGGLVSSYLTGVLDGEDPGGAGVLDALLGVTPMGLGMRDGRVGPESFGGTEPVSYVRMVPEHELAAGLERLRGSFKAPYRRVRADESDIAAWILESDYRLMDGQRFFSWYPGRPEAAYLVARHAGAGRTAYFASDPGTALFRSASDDCAAMLVRAVTWAGGGPPPIRVEAPPTVDVATATAADGTLRIVLANRTAHDLYATGRPGIWHSGPRGDTARGRWTSAVVPVAGVSVVIAPGTTAGERATSLRGADVSVRRIDGSLRVELGRLDDLDVLSIR